MKKTVLALFIILTLLLSCTVAFVHLASANPIWGGQVPEEPITTPPTINVSSPVHNETYFSPKVVLSFIVSDPTAWYTNTLTGAYPRDTMPYFENIIVGNITSVYYTLNDERQNLSVPNIPAFSPPTNGSLPTYLSYSVPLNLTAGRYSIRIYVEANSFYMPNIYTGNISAIVVNAVSQPISFSVKFPQPIIVAPESITYNESSVPLVFTVDTSAASWIGYNLDGKERVTIAGNTTLTGLTNGEHNITVYANDTLGDVYSSQTSNFTVALPTVTKPFPTVTVAAVLGASVSVAVVAGLLIYFKKRRH